jgi:hypothetical protein
MPSALATERETWERLKADLVAEHEGKYVLIKGTEIGGIFEGRAAAREAGYRRWGYVPLMIHRITHEEETEFLPIFDLASWDS